MRRLFCSIGTLSTNIALLGTTGHFPAVFPGRSLPLSVYDELIGMLSYGCIGELCVWVSFRETLLRHYIDVMTASTKNMTSLYDRHNMREMIELVRQAKGKLVMCKEKRDC